MIEELEKLAKHTEKKAGYDQLLFKEIHRVMKNNDLNLTEHKLGKWLKETYGNPKKTEEGRLYFF